MTPSFALFRPPLVLLVASTLLLGGAYPLLVRALIGHSWNAQVDDAAIRDPSGRVLASALDTASADAPQYFWGKIVSTAAPDCYLSRQAHAPECQKAIESRLALLKIASNAPVPKDLITFSVPGQMPQISPDAAAFQVHRVAQARGVSDAEVSSQVDRATHNPTYTLGRGLYVNVLELNLRLDGKLK